MDEEQVRDLKKKREMAPIIKKAAIDFLKYKNNHHRVIFNPDTSAYSFYNTYSVNISKDFEDCGCGAEHCVYTIIHYCIRT